MIFIMDTRNLNVLHCFIDLLRIMKNISNDL